MLERVDRMQLAVRDRIAAAATFAAILGAEKVRDDEVRHLGARRAVVRSGEAEFELLEPAGEGALSQHMERWGEGIFAAGFSCPDLPALSRRLAGRGLKFTDEGGQLFIEPDQTCGMRMVISPPVQAGGSGLLSWLYEVTNIVADHDEAARFYADAFGLDASRFSPIKSEEFGYKGTLTLVDPPARLDRIEITQITEPSRAMGRFFTRRGPSIYMCFSETPDPGEIAKRLEARKARHEARRDRRGKGSDEIDTVFVHPSALHGMLMGISRTNVAWLWSGRPELVPS